jgi:glycosyltransferase involved in cell wall biosynthesis
LPGVSKAATADVSVLIKKDFMTDRPRISVIVPVYNGEKFLHQCLGAIFASSYSNHEVIVVDDGSTDRSAEISREKGAIVLPSARRQSGPAAARNLAAQTARGEILLFVDADVVVKRDTLTKVARAFEQNPDIAALFGSYDDEPAEKNFLSQYKNLQHHFVHQTSNPEASTFWAGLGAVCREAFISIGGFDCEKFLIPSIEDIDLGVRLRSAGHRILLDRDIQAKHLKRWEVVSLVRTDIFCRALPWSKLLLTSRGMINDMNLKTADRLSSALVALFLIVAPLVLWNYLFALLLFAFLFGIFVLNRQILHFFAEKKGILFAAFAFPWLFLYFLYSGMTFVFCWFWYALPLTLRLRERQGY